MRRERRRRAVSAKIYAGLRTYGNFKLSKQCDNNEVLKALCKEAGWIVEEDGTTYRKGCNPPVESMDIIDGSVSISPSSSYQSSPHISYNPSPSSSSFPSPTHHMACANGSVNADSLIPWLKNLSSSASPKLPNFYIPGGSISAPVTPPSSSPTARTPRIVLESGPNSPTFSFISRNPFGIRDIESAGGGGSRMWTPGQSGTCSPAVPAGSDYTADVPMADGIAAEFAFGSCSTMGVVKAWEGERIHEECVPDDLELKL